MSAQRKIKRAVQRMGKVTVNKLVLALVRSGRQLPFINSSSVIVLSTVGRRSGLPRATPMGYVRIDPATLRVVSEHGTRSDWYRNAVAAGSVQVLLEGRNRPATVHLLAGEDPGAVLEKMGSKMVAAANRALWSQPEVIQISLTGP